MDFRPVRPKKIAVQIAEQLRNSILSGDFTPGEKLPPERELAQLFGVSRPPVREALNMLAASGLVETYQGGGTVVKSLVENSDGPPLSELIRAERERALDVIEVRTCMEGWTAWYAAQRALPEDIRTLEGIVDAMERNLSIQKTSEDLDASFHITIARATHNVVWLHLMQTIFDAMKEFQRGVWRAVYQTADDQKTLFQHHRMICAAIRDKDPVAAQERMIAHLRFAESRSSAYVRGTTL